MTWLTWRQLRGSVATTAALLLALAAALALTGPGLAARYAAGIAECTRNDTCDSFYNRFFGGHEFTFLAVSLVVLLLPAVVGVFWGAPMITRELDAGTHLLVWNQSVTRHRWLAVKLGLTVLAAVAAAGLCGLMVTWWSGPLDRSASENLAPMAPWCSARAASCRSRTRRSPSSSASPPACWCAARCRRWPSPSPSSPGSSSPCRWRSGRT